jgi:hypothetical protein
MVAAAPVSAVYTAASHFRPLQHWRVHDPLVERDHVEAGVRPGPCLAILVG